ncbi:MAG: hypothetical protein FWH27_14780 [Planctomycetaceae bacterium]|nr:hypothetical protein [Planctomycetaceae bacterium]
MDKKDKKKMQAYNAQLQHKKQQLAGEKRQPDDPAAIVQLEKEIAELEAKIKFLKNEG